MFVVTVTLAGAFPFTEMEGFTTADEARDRAAEWTELGGAVAATVDHVADWTARNIATAGLLVGLGAALGLDVALAPEAE